MDDFSSLKIYDTVFDPESKDGKLYIKENGSTTRFKVYVHLLTEEFGNAAALKNIKSVKYTLHPSFPDSEVTVDKTSQNP